jgi:hypothetical protein
MQGHDAFTLLTTVSEDCLCALHACLHGVLGLRGLGCQKELEGDDGSPGRGGGGRGCVCGGGGVAAFNSMPIDWPLRVTHRPQRVRAHQRQHGGAPAHHALLLWWQLGGTCALESGSSLMSVARGVWTGGHEKLATVACCAVMLLHLAMTQDRFKVAAHPLRASVRVCA